MADSSQLLIRGMGAHADEVTAFFFKELAERGIQNLQLSVGQLTVTQDGRSDSRDYFFAQRDLGRSALSTMAVRIASMGKDLFVEWRNYVLPPKGRFHWGIFWLSTIGFWLASLAITVMLQALNPGGVPVVTCGLILVSPIVGLVAAWGRRRKDFLEGFQSQDNDAFKLAVQAALEEAIDSAGISRTLIQNVSSGSGGQRRLI